MYHHPHDRLVWYLREQPAPSPFARAMLWVFLILLAFTFIGPLIVAIAGFWPQ